MSDAKQPASDGQDSPAGANTSRFPGPIKAALWLLSVDRELAVQIVSQLEAQDIRTLRQAVQSLGEINPKDLELVHSEFARAAQSPPLFVRGSMEYLNKIATDAFGHARARELLAEEEPVQALTPTIDRADPDAIAGLLKQQHPQVISAVLASLPAERANTLLEKLPEDLQTDVIARIAKLKRVPHLALKQAEESLTAGMPVTTDADRELDGVEVAAALLKGLEQEDAEAIIEKLADAGKDVADDLREAMFTFDDLANADTAGIQKLLKEVDQRELATALKTASDTVKEKVFSSISKRAAQMLEEDMSILGPVRLRDVEKAQKSIIEVAQRLRDEGTLNIAAKEDLV